VQSIITLRTSQSRQCSLQWRALFRMMRVVLRRLSVLAIALTMVLPLGFHAQAHVGCAHAVATDCCGANCPPPATHSATGTKCCAFSRLPFSSSRTTCETNFFSGSGNDRASKLAFSVLRSADRTNKIICQVVANSTSIRSSLLSPTLTSSNIAFGQPKVSSLIPIKGNRGHGDAGITVGTNVQLGAVRYPMGGGR
jgi:hypothetical protein